MVDASQTARRKLMEWTIALTVLAEGLTLGLRYTTQMTAVEFNRTAPLLLQVHHMFWSVPLFAAALFFRRGSNPRLVLAALALAMIVSDLLHHFVVLPILVGNTGWHWP